MTDTPTPPVEAADLKRLSEVAQEMLAAYRQQVAWWAGQSANGAADCGRLAKAALALEAALRPTPAGQDQRRDREAVLSAIQPILRTHYLDEDDGTDRAAFEREIADEAAVKVADAILALPAFSAPPPEARTSAQDGSAALRDDTSEVRAECNDWAWDESGPCIYPECGCKPVGSSASKAEQLTAPPPEAGAPEDQGQAPSVEYISRVIDTRLIRGEVPGHNFPAHWWPVVARTLRQALATHTPPHREAVEPQDSVGAHLEKMLREAVATGQAAHVIIFDDGTASVEQAQDAAIHTPSRREAVAPVPDLTAVREAPFQARVQPWLLACFGPEIAGDREERNHRFLEEALELVQSCGCGAGEAHQLVDYVYGRPVGEARQEIGGVMVTLAALCLANDFDMHEAAEAELARIWTKVEKIRAKQAAKPKYSPLPEAAAIARIEGQADRPAGYGRQEIGREQVMSALRTYEQWGGALRFLEKDKWHLSDVAAMRKVLEGFVASPSSTTADSAGPEVES